VRQVGYLQGL